MLQSLRNNGGKDRSVPLLVRFGLSPSPFKVYLVIICFVFILDSIEGLLTPHFFPFLIQFPREFTDPVLTTIFIAPFLWLILFRPLRQALLDESIRHETVKAQVVDAIVTIDVEGIIISCNPAAERIFGYRPEEINSKHAATLFCDDALTAENLEILANNDDCISPFIHEVTCHTKDGVGLKLEISVSRLMIAGAPQFLVIMRDITRRKKLEREAKELQTKLIQANKMTALGLMVSGVAHEINNPNNYILSNAQLLDRSCGDIIKVLREYQAEHGELLIGGLPFEEMEKHFPGMISGIITGTQRINGIVNDLKTFSRQGSDGIFEEVDINAAVRAAVSIVRSQIARHTKNFSMQLAENLPTIYGNSQKLGQVTINLLMNAAQSLQQVSAAISLETRLDKETSEIVISVSDEGCGINESIAASVMDPFFTTRLECGGSGLGLSISDSIVKEHSGRLIFNSLPGKGTVFEVRLPVSKLDIKGGE